MWDGQTWLIHWKDQRKCYIKGLAEIDANSLSPNFPKRGEHSREVPLTQVTVLSARLRHWSASSSSVFSLLQVGPSSWLKEVNGFFLPLKIEREYKPRVLMREKVSKFYF